MKSITINIPDESFKWLQEQAAKDYRSTEDLASIIVQKEQKRRAENCRRQKEHYERWKAGYVK